MQTAPEFPSKTSSVFRTDIQCLRGLAVLAVVLFHLTQKTLMGGYQGVDVFFVISGFVIMSSLVREIQNSGKMSLPQFYFRRFKRLYPPLLGVVAITMILANIFIPLYENREVVKTGIFSLFGLSNNFLFLSSLNYFTLAATENPYLHTWSLGIEEQFYFVFSGIICLLLWIRSRKNRIKIHTAMDVLLLGIAGFGLLSFGWYLFQVLWIGANGSAFYLLPARCWQFSLGAIGAVLTS